MTPRDFPRLLTGRRRLSRVAVLIATVASVAFGASNSGMAQVGGYQLWQEITEQQAAGRLPAALKSAARRDIVPEVYRTLVLDNEFMAQLLGAAPSESAKRSTRSGSEIILPLPQGGYGRFSVLESPLMEPDLAAQFPEIKNYLVQGIDDPTATGRIDTSNKGFRAMVISASGTFFIDPYWSNSDDISICYAKQDFISHDKMHEWACGVVGEDSPAARVARDFAAQPRPTGASLRIYRAAIAATGEYTAFHGGTVAGALAAINTSLARVNAIYERDFCIRMVLVGSNASIIYTNSSTDPYTNSDGEAMLGQNQTNLDSVIGNANYDIGHVFSTGGGGVAGLGVVCVTGQKAQGVTGSSSPVGDPFDVDYVAHEIGHQFRGNHTFNALANLQWNSSTAFEPGSGSTIMAYAGIVSGQNLQSYSDDHFHAGSYTEIDDFTTTGAGAGAFSTAPTGNSPPEIAVLPDYTIPARTPFALTASATDANDDALTYCWEEYDVGPQQNPVASNPRDNGSSPLFRSYSPTTDPTRFFPSLPYVLNNSNIPPVTYTSNGVATWATGEYIPTTSRTMTFRVSVRDNRAGGGGHDWAATQVTTVASAGPFRVSSQNTGSSIAAGVPFNVTWDVAGTDMAPIGVANVKISLSTNGGTNFPIVLAESAPNNGTASVTIPADINTTAARLKVEAVGNIFFDISDASFTVFEIGVPVVRIDAPSPGAKFLPGDTVSLRASASDLTDAGAPGSITLVEFVANGAVVHSVVVDPAVASAEVTHDWVPEPGDYTVEARATDDAGKVGISAPVPIAVRYPQLGELTYDFDPPSADNAVRTVTGDDLGRIYVGGAFTLLGESFSAPRLARLLPTGEPDPRFYIGSGFNGEVRCLLHSAEDRGLYVGGIFTSFGGVARPGLVRLGVGHESVAEAELDPGFFALFDEGSAVVNALARQYDGKLLVGGSFSMTVDIDGEIRQWRNVVRLNPDGGIDTGFGLSGDTFAPPNPSGPVHAIRLQPDGKILLGGEFAQVQGSSRRGLVRLTSGGAVDSSLAVGTGFNGRVQALALAADGTIYAGGNFSSYNGRSFYNNLVKLSATGTLDGRFNYALDSLGGLNGAVNNVQIRPTGEVLVSGLFTQIANTVIPVAPTAVGRVVQLRPDGSIDPAFNPGGSGANNTVHNAATLANGNLVVVGAFSSFNSEPVSRIAVIAGSDGVVPLLTSGQFRTVAAGGDLDLLFTSSAVPGPVEFELVSGTLPRGVTFDPATGSLSGIPLDAGSFVLSIRPRQTPAGPAGETVSFTLHVLAEPVSYDEWRRAWFTGGDLTDNAVSGPAAPAPNIPGLSNLAVYAMSGGNPFDPTSTEAPSLTRMWHARKQYWAFSVSKYPLASAVYVPQVSQNLTDWASENTASPDSSPLSTIENTADFLRVRSTAPIPQFNNQFFRLRVTVP